MKLLFLIFLVGCAEVSPFSSGKALPARYLVSCKLTAKCGEGLEVYCGPYTLLEHKVDKDKNWQQYVLECKS